MKYFLREADAGVTLGLHSGDFNREKKKEEKEKERDDIRQINPFLEKTAIVPVLASRRELIRKAALERYT